MRGRYFLLLIFLLSFVSSEPKLNLQDNFLQPGETILGNITGENFINKITSEDISFFEGRKKVFFESEVKEYNSTYYIYAYTTREGNFTLRIPNILYKENGALKLKTIETEVYISKKLINEDNNTGSKILEVRPGFVDFSKGSKIKLVNKGDFPIVVDYLETSVELNASEEIEIGLEPLKEFSYINFYTYKTFQIPLIPSGREEIVKREPLINYLRTINKSLILKVSSEEKNEEIIYLINAGDKSLSNISFSSTIDFIEFSKTYNEILANQTVNLSLLISPKGRGQIEGMVNISYSSFNQSGLLKIPITLLIVPSGVGKENVSLSSKTCGDEGGVVCKDSKICDGKAIYSADGKYCCLSKCVIVEDPNEESNIGWMIGVSIFVVIALVGFWAYRKQKKLKQKPENSIAKVTEKYNKRLKGGLRRG